MSDDIIYAVILSLRLFIPLLIPRFPLPAILTAMIIDAFDHPVLYNFTNANMDNYQGVDKALDIYYLTIAYLSTLRNWTNKFAYRAVQFLFYYRLVGVALFEITQIRPLLIIFPNTFEYYFVFYEIIRLRWDQSRVAKRLVVWSIVLIWVFIKLPQEYMLHIAHTDFVALFNKYFFFVEPIPQSIAMRPWLTLFWIGVIVAIVYGIVTLVRRYAPKPDHGFRFGSPAPLDMKNKIILIQEKARKFNIKYPGLWEKALLLTLLTTIFAQILPGVEASGMQIVIGIVIFVVVNTFISHLLALRGVGWESITREFVVMAVVNTVVIYAFSLLVPGELHFSNALFFVYLLTLLTTMYDRYRVVYEKRYYGKTL